LTPFQKELVGLTATKAVERLTSGEVAPSELLDAAVIVCRRIPVN